jgi:hypothetical protein
MTQPPIDDTKAGSLDHSQKRRLDLVANALRVTWRMPIITAIVLAVLIVAAFMVLRFVWPLTTTTFISRFQFTFPGAQTGRYSNGLDFTINEIIDSAILDEVYNELELNRYGVGHATFYSAFSIRPFSLTEREIAETFRQQLADRRLLIAERERLENQLRDRLEIASRGAAELSFTLPGRLMLPPEVGRAVVRRVPRTWAQVAIEKKGVLRIPGFTAVGKIIPEETIDRQPLPLAILVLIEASQRLDDRLFELANTSAEIGNTPGIWTVRDSLSGKSFRDLEWDVRELQLFHINPLRAALMTYRFPKSERELRDILQQRISHLEFLESNATRQAQAIGENLARFVDATASLNRGAPERRATEQGSASGTTIPQVSESFIDKIIELTRASVSGTQNQAFIKERTRAQFDLIRQADKYRGEQNRLKELLAALPSDVAASKELDETRLAHLAQQLRFAIDEANSKWATLSRLEAEFAADRLGRTAEIYSPLSVGADVVQFDPIFNRSALAAAMSMLIIFWLGLWALRAGLFWWRTSRQVIGA